MSCDLTKHHINILDVHHLRDDEYAVMFEYCYFNKDKSKVWAKDFLVFQSGTLANNIVCDWIDKMIVDYVDKARSELEK